MIFLPQVKFESGWRRRLVTQIFRSLFDEMRNFLPFQPFDALNNNPSLFYTKQFDFFLNKIYERAQIIGGMQTCDNIYIICMLKLS